MTGVQTCALPISGASGTPNRLVVNYTATETITLTFAAAYNWGGYATAGRTAFSGTNAWDDLSGVETQPGNSWLAFSVATSDASQGLSAFGVCVCGRNNSSASYSGPGAAVFTLSDGSEESVSFDKFGGYEELQRIFIGYEAPQGKYITAVRYTRPGAGNSFIAFDDFAIAVTPEPATIGLLIAGGLLADRRRR